MHHGISAPNAASPSELVALAVDAARLLPPPLQQPRPPVWVAAMSNHAGPYVATSEYAAAGATWLLEPCGLRRRLLDGPPT